MLIRLMLIDEIWTQCYRITIIYGEIWIIFITSSQFQVADACLVGGLEHVFFSHSVGNFIILTDSYVLKGLVETTNQIYT